MSAVIFAIISSVGFGFSNAYWKKAHADIAFPNMVFYRGLIGTSVLGLVWMICEKFEVKQYGISSHHAPLSEYGKAWLLCTFCSFGLVSFLQSLKYSAVSVTIPLSSVNLFNILTAVFVLHEEFKSVYYLSFPLAAVGVIIINQKKNEKSAWNKGAVYALLATFFWGISYALFKFTTQSIGPLALSFTLELSVTITAFFWMYLSKNPPSRADISKENRKHYWVLAGLLIVNSFTFNLAIQGLPVLTFNLLSYLQTLVSIVLGMMMFNEKLTIRQYFGIACIIASILLTQVYH